MKRFSSSVWAPWRPSTGFFWVPEPFPLWITVSWFSSSWAFCQRDYERGGDTAHLWITLLPWDDLSQPTFWSQHSPERHIRGAAAALAHPLLQPRQRIGQPLKLFLNQDLMPRVACSTLTQRHLLTNTGKVPQNSTALLKSCTTRQGAGWSPFPWHWPHFLLSSVHPKPPGILQIKLYGPFPFQWRKT